MTAQEAKDMANNFVIKDSEGEYQRIIKNIKEKAAKGSFQANASSITEIVKAKLIYDGYEIKYYHGDPRDPREHSYYTINWK